MAPALVDRLALLETLNLESGAHDSFAKGVCAMEAAAWLANEPHSDKPTCVSATLPSRLANHVSQRLGTDCSFVRWQRDPKTGADVPIFAVPAHALIAARALGLSVESV